MGSHIAAPGEQLGDRCLAQGSHLSRGIEGGESTCYSLPPTDNPCRTWESNRQPLGYKSNSLTIRPRLPLEWTAGVALPLQNKSAWAMLALYMNLSLSLSLPLSPPLSLSLSPSLSPSLPLSLLPLSPPLSLSLSASLSLCSLSPLSPPPPHSLALSLSILLLSLALSPVRALFIPNRFFYY